MDDFDSEKLAQDLKNDFGGVFEKEENTVSHADIFKKLDEAEKKRKEKNNHSASSLASKFQDPTLLAASIPLGVGTSIAQHVAPSSEAQLLVKQLQREAMQNVVKGNVPPSGLTSIQKYAGSQQSAIAPQHINPVVGTPSNVQSRIVTPLTEGTNRVLNVAPSARPIPGSEAGLIHEGTPSSTQAIQNNPLLNKAKVNVPAVSSGSRAAEQLATLMEDMRPSQRKMIESMLQKGYAIPDALKIFGRISIPVAVASVPQEVSSAYEAFKKGDYPRMVSSGLGALGGTALGVGTGLAAIGLAPEIAGGLALTGGISSLAPVAHAVYDYLNPSKP